MTLKDLKNKHLNGTLSDQEWETAAEQYIPAMLRKLKREQWAAQLAEKGIHRHPSAITRPFYLRYWAAAAIFVALLSAVWFLKQWNTAPDAYQMAAQYLDQPFLINSSATRGDSAAQQNFFRGQALEAFQNRDYEKAIAYLQQIEAEQSLNASDYFQLGLALAYQQQPDYQRAILAFEKARQLDPSKYKDEIQWFTALCYIMLNNQPQAEQLLRDIANSPSSRNQSAAQKLLEQL
jgi:tetratricopeptide (TPR) repeat protein